MAQVQQLPFGAISPAASPVSAYIQPLVRQVGQPVQAPRFGSPKGLSLQGTAGTTFVQGSNQFKDLARDLQPFSEQLVKTTQKAGLAFASWQMDLGEQQALEQTAEAQARIDEEMETAELNRAAANRELAYQDPNAGNLMNLLNPYRQIGYQRGMAKRAGQEIEVNMASYVAQNGNFDYNTPDQGFAELQRVRAEFTNSVLEKYGVNSSTPGYSKYVAPRVEKASDAVAQTLQKDRADYLDNQKPATIAALVLNEWDAINATNTVTLNGQTYSAEVDGQQFEMAKRMRLNQIVQQELMTSGLPGQMAGWEEDVYKILAAERDYNDQNSPLDVLTTNVPLTDAAGKKILDRYGNVRFLTWNERYRKQGIDSEIKYDQARFTQANNTRKELGLLLQGQIAEATRGMPAGPERYAAAERAFNNFIATYEASGQRMDTATKASLFDAWKKGNETTLTLSGQMDDPYVVEGFVSRVNQSFGANFNANARRDELALIAQGITDPGLRGRLMAQGEAAISAREKQEDVAANYGQTYRPIITLAVDQALEREYGNRPTRRGQKAEGEANLRAVIEPAVQQALRLKEAELGRRLTQDEAGQLAREAIKAADLDQVVYPDGRTQQQNNADQEAAQAALSPTWKADQLADIPNRRAVLRTYRTTRILDSSAIAEAVENSTYSYPQNKALRRAARDANAPSLFDFVESQLKLLEQEVPDYVRPWSPAEWRRFRDRNLRSAGLEKSLYATQRLSETRPQLASIQGWIIPSTFQV